MQSMMNTKRTMDMEAGEPVIRYDDDHQFRKHRTLLKVFVVFAIIALIVLGVLWAVRRATSDTYVVPSTDELNATSEPVMTSVELRGAALNNLSQESREVTESREEQESALSALHNAN